MKTSSVSDYKTATLADDTRPEKSTALLWDESFLWGVTAYKALKASGISFDVISSGDLKDSVLSKYSVLFVPGGWASNKLKALGDSGINEIRRYVSGGGNYFGICGGAGLATLDGIGLLNIERKPTSERVPSFSGRIFLNINNHPVWGRASVNNAPTAENHASQITHHESRIFHAWWPSQFVIKGDDIEVLATYGDALPDSFSSDLNTGDVWESGRDWKEYEAIYRINLNPKRLLNEPAVVEGRYGKGKVILSLVHFDTPEDGHGADVLIRLFEYLGAGIKAEGKKRQALYIPDYDPSFSVLSLITEIESAAADLIDTGICNFLWFWRNSMLLQWRRGVRGLEYCAMHVMIKEIAGILRQGSGFLSESHTSGNSQDSETELFLMNALNDIKELILPFTEKARRLLVMERFAMQSGHITYDRCDDAGIQQIREDLFSGSKSHGGTFKRLIDRIDSLLYTIIKQNENTEKKI